MSSFDDFSGRFNSKMLNLDEKCIFETHHQLSNKTTGIAHYVYQDHWIFDIVASRVL